MNGVYNAVSPRPVTSRELFLTLARVRGKKTLPLKVPPILLKAVLGEMSIEVLKSTTVSCGKILEQGYVFKYPSLEKALKDTESKQLGHTVGSPGGPGEA